ncbi:hypothetical protein HYT55_03795 [Candidatus Woesearchaeota archaeon]|nr:hypothetical protein [Candidatus Woesearchaeota archaeon]
MDWKFYITLPGFDRSGLGFAADVDYQINDSPTTLLIGCLPEKIFLLR